MNVYSSLTSSSSFVSSVSISFVYLFMDCMSDFSMLICSSLDALVNSVTTFSYSFMKSRIFSTVSSTVLYFSSPVNRYGSMTHILCSCRAFTSSS